MSFDISVVSIVLCCCVAFFAGYHVGTKHTTISPVNNYTGPIDKLIINGEVRWVAPRQDTKESAPQPTTAAARNAADTMVGVQ
jgi:hypothetical protein